MSTVTQPSASGTTTGAQNTGNPFDLPQFGGPYTAPLTQGQLDALEGFNRLTQQGPLVQNADVTKSLQAAMSGMPSWDPKTGKTLGEWTSMFAMPGVSADLARSLATNTPKFDTTALFKTGEDVMKSDLANALAKTREEYSGLGLGPGSTDRSQGLTRTAGDIINQYRLGQQQIGMSAFENAANRQLSALPQLAAFEQQPFQNMMAVSEPAAARSISSLPYVFQAQQEPYNNYMQQYGLNEAARTVADTEAQRRWQEFSRTQGGALQQLLSILSGTPLNNTTIGPSWLSQYMNMVGGVAKAAAGAG